MPEDLPLWIERFAELLGCDARAASIAVAIEDLLAERERQRKTIGQLRGRNAKTQQLEKAETACILAGWHEGRCPGTASRSEGRCMCVSHQASFPSPSLTRIDTPSAAC